MNMSRYMYLKIRKYNRNISVGTARKFSNSWILQQENASAELTGAYNPKNVESWKYDKWDKENRFVHNVKKKCPVYSLVLPPPNVTGSLHLGHALTTTLQDVLSRWKRMSGFEVCWLPGTDHAGIATQAVVEKHLSKNGITRHSLGRMKFEEEVWKWKEKHGGRIIEQLKIMGASLDWSREVFTMDKKQTIAVRKAFLDLFKRGLIYRGNHLVNWSCALQSTISDIEVDNLEILEPTDIKVPGYSQPIKFGLLTEFAYKLEDSNEEIIVSTTRPETMLGDVAIAVNPEDSRYSQYIGRTVSHPFLSKSLPIIADNYVDKDFGTGALKITPAHDRNDYAIATRHNLPLVCVINESGLIDCEGTQFSGLKRYNARDAILKVLESKTLLRNIKPHPMSIPICSRSDDIIELLPRPQWYINCKKMASEAVKSVDNKELQIVPESFNTVWNKWLLEERDWCISRQLWWGHQIPAYRCYNEDSPGNFYWVAAENEPEAKEKAIQSYNLNKDKIICEQDEDVLDTWFSSSLYPFSSWGWPEQTEDFQRLYPLSIMVTGHDILRFWVCRMVMLGTELTGNLPFPKILLHGIICDAHGSKMSKSKGNVVDPEDIIKGISLQELNDKALKSYESGSISKEEYKKTINGQKKQFPNGIPQCGADALRFTLCSKNVTNHFIYFDVDDCHTNQLFGNKIWQSLKFWRNANELSLKSGDLGKCRKEDLNLIDLWIMSRLCFLVKQINESLEMFQFHTATAALKQFLYAEVCDVYVECTKLNLQSLSEGEARSRALAAHCHTFSACFNTSLRCLAPFMPYLTEELIPTMPMTANCLLPKYDDSIQNLQFPKPELFLQYQNEKLEENVAFTLEIISTVRQLRNTYQIPNKIKPSIYIESTNVNLENILLNHSDIINFLTKSIEISIKKQDSLKTFNIWSFLEDGKSKIFLELSDADEYLKVGAAKLLKKKEKLLKKLEKLEMIVNHVKYETKTSQEQQNSTVEKINVLKEELQKMEKFEVKN